MKTPAGGHKTKLIPLKKTPATPKTPSQPARIVYFKVVRQPRCEVPKSGTSPGTPAVDIQIAWKVAGTSTVAFSDDEPNYYESHGRRAGKLGTFPAVDTVSMEFPCNDGEETTHSYTIDNMSGAPHVKRTIKYTLP
ncbi:hypothetical protein [Kribbella sp. NPDC004536]|uniref:hypothetical protein n=1 Tax=Kribbella sp. NPDC004536 TaxID=3364106 RepID=UPI0036A06570